jgi:hypothetical protein
MKVGIKAVLFAFGWRSTFSAAIQPALLQTSVRYPAPAAKRRKHAAHGASRGYQPENAQAPQGQKNAAHGASRGLKSEDNQAPQGRKKTYPADCTAPRARLLPGKEPHRPPSQSGRETARCEGPGSAGKSSSNSPSPVGTATALIHACHCRCPYRSSDPEALSK